MLRVQAHALRAVRLDVRVHPWDSAGPPVLLRTVTVLLARMKVGNS